MKYNRYSQSRRYEKSHIHYVLLPLQQMLTKYVSNQQLEKYKIRQQFTICVHFCSLNLPYNTYIHSTGLASSPKLILRLNNLAAKRIHFSIKALFTAWVKI